MKAMVLRRVVNLADNRAPLELVELPIPEPGDWEILIRVSVCGVCHTELDEIEGRTPPSRFPMILGHQIVGRVEQAGRNASRFRPGDRVGMGWINHACGRCHLCRAGKENLCPDFQATGRDASGGYAQYTTVSQDFAYGIPEVFTDEEAAPLLCAGAIGYRSLRLTGLRDGETLGLVGFGASAHLVLKMVRHLFPRSRIFAFSRTPAERDFARELGAAWAGGFEEEPPAKMHRAIDTTPAWQPIVAALLHLEPGGRLVINAIRKEERDKEALLGLDYPRHLWLEKEIKSVANVSRRDVAEFLELAAQMPIKPEYQVYRLEEANQALVELKERKIRGAKVLRVD
ncbi:MAG: zinc-dependent alcohol dehydrogenase family protein [Deltaproteobacteria bacterium]|nr:zinc-dependent alcohol dehydrogenase family protein [Deltaproteobacteria bacterium]